MKPGDVIEVMCGRRVGGGDVWRRYEVLDWEVPRQDDRGRWLFTARAIRHSGDNAIPMVVGPDRIRTPEPDAEACPVPTRPVQGGLFE